jgi:hypothetical protein
MKMQQLVQRCIVAPVQSECYCASICLGQRSLIQLNIRRSLRQYVRISVGEDSACPKSRDGNSNQPNSTTEFHNPLSCYIIPRC